MLTTLYEVVVWLPVLLGGLLGLAPEDRPPGSSWPPGLAGLFSWGYQAVTTVLAPQIATAFANSDAAAARRVLKAGALAGIAVELADLPTREHCLPAPLLEDLRRELRLVGLRCSCCSSWPARSTRPPDPVGEALMVGRRTWVDVRFVTAGVAAGRRGGRGALASQRRGPGNRDRRCRGLRSHQPAAGASATCPRSSGGGADWQQAVLPLAAVTLAVGAALAVVAVAWRRRPARAEWSVAIGAALLTAAGLIALGIGAVRLALGAHLPADRGRRRGPASVLALASSRPVGRSAGSATPGLVGLESGVAGPDRHGGAGNAWVRPIRGGVRAGLEADRG